MHSNILPSYCISGRPLSSVGGVILHYFSARNVDPDNKFDMHVCRDLLLDLNRNKVVRKRYMKEDKWPAKRMYASAHVLIGRAGEVWRLVEFDQQAYHAGASSLNGKTKCNRWTLGVELVGDNHSGFTDEQYGALADFLKSLGTQYSIDRDAVAGHDSVRWEAINAGSRARPKYDPSGRKDGLGDNFDWDFLYSLWE